jgi:hypothetical protein
VQNGLGVTNCEILSSRQGCCASLEWQCTTPVPFSDKTCKQLFRITQSHAAL